MIRPYTLQDKSVLLHLLQLNTPQYFAPAEAADYSAYLDQERETYLVVEEAGQLIGAGGINFFPQSAEARLSWDVVHPDWQEQGIGRALTQYRINLVQARSDVRQLVVRTTQLVYPFYAKMGFVLEKTAADFWAPGFHLYQLRLRW